MLRGLLLVLLCASDADQARGLVRNARAMFDAGQFEQAAVLLEQAQTLVPSAATLYNLGRAREKAGQLELAVAAYRRYLEAAPMAGDRGSVEATVAELTQRLDERRRLEQLENQPPQIVIAPEPVIERKSIVRTVVPWWMVGVGVAAVGTAVAFGVMANGSHASAQLLGDVDAAVSRQQLAYGQATIANALYVSGAIVAVSAIVWLVLERVLAP